MFTTNTRFVVKEYTSTIYFNSNIYKERVIGVGIKYKTTGCVMPTPLTNYIKHKYRGKKGSLSSQRNAAYELIKFLNFIIIQIAEENLEFTHLMIDGVFGLNLTHASRYISFMSHRANAKDISADYVYRMEDYLIRFYKWLQQNEIINNSIDLQDDNPLGNLDLETIYPRVENDNYIKNKLVDFGENRYELTKKFISVARDVAPEIALGICFQVFGGLRKGEIVNLTKSSIESPYYWDEKDIGDDKFILKVRYRADLLFTNKTNLAHEQVKKTRDQSLIVNSILSQVYLEHKNLLKKLNSKKHIPNADALFINFNTGDPLSGSAYMYRFNKVKNAFLREISEEGRTKVYLFLTDKEWSSHLGRGIFTNFLLQISDNITDVAVARGDSDIKPMMDYVQEENALELTKEAINMIKQANNKGNATIDNLISSKIEEETQ